MLANEARQKACEIIWNSLPSILCYNIEDAVNKGGFNCEIIFNDDKMDKANFDDCIGYFNNLDELGYQTAMYRELGTYVIAIMW